MREQIVTEPNTHDEPLNKCSGSGKVFANDNATRYRRVWVFYEIDESGATAKWTIILCPGFAATTGDTSKYTFATGIFNPNADASFQHVTAFSVLTR